MDDNHNYHLTKTISGEYRLDRGPRPSGFAWIRVELQPLSTQNKRVSGVEVPSNRFWQVRNSKAFSHSELENAQQQIIDFLPTIINGIQEGVEDGFANVMDSSVVNIQASIKQIEVDPIYSTEKSFYFAAKSAVERILLAALRDGEIYSETG